MSLVRNVKTLVEHIPYGLGHWGAYVPYRLRLGHSYQNTQKLLLEANKWTDENREEYAIHHFKMIFEYARSHFSCYQKLYSDVLNLTIESFTDIAKVPTIDKEWTRSHFDEFTGADRLNTGGSSGVPTPFWMDSGCWGREWAHFHYMWGIAGYRQTDLKLTIRGKNLGPKPFIYNPVHNEYIINTYLSVKDYGSQLLKLFARRDFRWIHGYPSSIYQFIIECEEFLGAQKFYALTRNVRGVLLSSEYPHPNMIKKFKQYGFSIVNWYGHSEMCVLAQNLSAAFHDEPNSDGTSPEFLNSFTPYVTYGLTEVVDGHLLGTSYHNFDMPLIRYDTGDLVRCTESTERGLCKTFEIQEGRSGDFIEDRFGKKVSLTALIFGRHHQAFDIADYIQIRQDSPGRATIYLTLKKGYNGNGALLKMFDLSNVEIEFKIEQLASPIRTKLGKLKLRLSRNDF